MFSQIKKYILSNEYNHFYLGFGFATLFCGISLGSGFFIVIGGLLTAMGFLHFALQEGKK